MTERLENELNKLWRNGRVGEFAVTYVMRRKGWRMSCDVGDVTERWRMRSMNCDVGEATEGLENEL